MKRCKDWSSQLQHLNMGRPSSARFRDRWGICRGADRAEQTDCARAQENQQQARYSKTQTEVNKLGEVGWGVKWSEAAPREATGNSQILGKAADKETHQITTAELHVYAMYCSAGPSQHAGAANAAFFVHRRIVTRVLTHGVGTINSDVNVILGSVFLACTIWEQVVKVNQQKQSSRNSVMTVKNQVSVARCSFPELWILQRIKDVYNLACMHTSANIFDTSGLVHNASESSLTCHRTINR